jgi:oxalate decarboxylase/phosphoglucose isomerase-like protein (cupin superfamily)
LSPFIRAGCCTCLPRWAHRSVNASLDEDLITFFIYPGDAGHDYGTIEQQGFRKLVVEQDWRTGDRGQSALGGGGGMKPLH